MTVPRDATGRTLADYPHPNVAVDTAVLTLMSGADDKPALGVVLVRRERVGARAGWALPGTFLHEGETLADAVRRSLLVKAGITGRDPEQLHVFDAPGRDDRGWVLSVAHFDVVAPTVDLVDPGIATVRPVDRVPALPYDHRHIVRRAVERLRAEYERSPDPRGLLPEAFPIADLRAVHEAVAGHPLQKDTFRRSMLAALTPIDGIADGRVGRPAQLFARTHPRRP